MNVLVLGATGFIGGHIAKAAYDAGWYTRGFRRDQASTGHLGDLEIDWFTGNLDDTQSLKHALQNIDVVFHVAGYYPARNDRRPLAEQVRYVRTQTEAVIATISQANISHFVYTSSLSTIGFPPPGSDRLADEKDYYQPGDLKKSAYYEVKYVMESMILEATSQGFPAVILNPTAVFGPGDVHLTLGRLIIAAAHGRMIAWLPGIVNVIDVRDVAAAHIQAVKLGSVGERYILGGQNLGIKEAMYQVSQILGTRAPRFKIPLGLIDGLIKIDNLFPNTNLTGNHLQALVRWRGFDSSKATQFLELKTRPFAESIRDARDWFIENGYLQK